jgi:hypothetical protein
MFIWMLVVFYFEPGLNDTSKWTFLLGFFAVLIVVPWVIGRAARYILAGESEMATRLGHVLLLIAASLIILRARGSYRKSPCTSGALLS